MGGSSPAEETAYAKTQGSWCVGTAERVVCKEIVTEWARLRKLAISHRTLDAIRHSRFPPEDSGKPLCGGAGVGVGVIRCE